MYMTAARRVGAIGSLALLLAVATGGTAQAMKHEGQGEDESMRGGMQQMMAHMAGKHGMQERGQMGEAGVPNLPPVKGFADGEPMFFVHPEASDPAIARKLGFMMGSPVAVVSALADAPEEMLAEVYVFTNGVSGMGPLGFQPDVLDAMPGEEGYSPLRRLNLVSWQDPGEAQELRSASAVREAEASDQITIERPGVVINMPVLKWNRGRR